MSLIYSVAYPYQCVLELYYSILVKCEGSDKQKPFLINLWLQWDYDIEIWQ